MPLIFHIPHASTLVPDDAGLIASPAYITEQIRVLTDHHTDKIFGACARAEDAVILAPVSRIVVDVERFPDDAHEPMSAVGMGAVYVRGCDGGELRHSNAARDVLLQRYYAPHHAALEAAVDGHLGAHGQALILDCHSFPAQAHLYEGDLMRRRPEICIGTDAFHTPDILAEHVEQVFAKHGFEVARDTPFAGALVPQHVYRRDKRVTSVMVELRRDLYMDEETSELMRGALLVQSALNDAVAVLRDYAGP
jgi:N-formylglutamate deformylase